MNNLPKEAAERRSTRVALTIPIVIHGKDAHNRTFREETHTLIVNQHGAKLLTSRQLAVGAEIRIENPVAKSVARSNVVWVGTNRTANGMLEVGVQLAEAQNVWGIEFPPQDWSPTQKEMGTPAAEEAPATGPAREEGAPAKTRTLILPAPTIGAPPKTLPPTRLASAEGAPAKTPTSTLTSEQIATQFLHELHETAGVHLRQFRERVDQVVEQVSQDIEKDLRRRAAATRKAEVAAIEQQMLAYTERLGALNTEAAELDARIDRKSVV